MRPFEIAILLMMWAGAAEPNLAAAERNQAASGAAPGDSIQQIRLRGRIVCLPEEIKRQYGVELPARHEHQWALKTAEGKVYVVLRTRYSEPIFLDQEVRSRELVLKGRLFPKAPVLEVTAIHSIRDGVEQDLYYYCDVCSIKSISPETCVCCQGPVRLVEKPLNEKSEQN